MRYILFILFTLFISACSSTLIEPSDTETTAVSGVERPPSAESVTSTVEVKELPKKNSPIPADEVQLIWAVPEVPVDNYIIYYGFSRDKLDNKINIALDQVDTFKDPRFGTVHRYYISNIPIDKTIYVSIAAMRGTKVSKAGEIIELKPEKK